MIGHSLGAAFILDYLEQTNKKIKAAFLVAGYHKMLENEFKELNKSFVDKQFNWDKIKANCGKFFVFGSAISIPAGSAITAKLGRKLGMGSVMGLFNTAFGIGAGVGPIIAGLIMVATGLAFVFVSSAIVVLIGTIIFYYLMKSNIEYRTAHVEAVSE